MCGARTHRQVDAELPRITLVCRSPGPEGVAGDGAPCLNRLIRLAHAPHAARQSVEAVLFDAFGYPVADGVDLPVAAVTQLLAPGASAERWWVRADPVFLQADRDNVTMVADLTADLSADDRQGLVEHLAPVFADAGLELQTGSAGWFLSGATDPGIGTTPLSDVLGRHILSHLPRGAGGGRWRRLLNEVQMALHDVAVNQRRIAAGRLPANSLWFWGSGMLPTPVRPGGAPWVTWSDNRVARGLAQLSGTTWRPAPDNAAVWRTQAASGSHLVTIEPEPAAGASVAVLESAWIAPLWKALKSQQVASVTVILAMDFTYTVTARQLRPWWKIWR